MAEKLTTEQIEQQKIVQSMASMFGGNTVIEKSIDKPIDKVEEKPADVIIDKPIDKAEKPVDKTIEEKKEVPVVKSFEDYLAEKTAGKYTKWEDVEKELTPKELKFANEKIEHFNELAKKGIDVTSKEFLQLQSIDFEKMDGTADLLLEKWKRTEDGEGLSDKTIRNEINKKYNVDEWSGKETEDLTEDDIANQEKFLRDAGKAKDWLINYKNERVLEKQIDPKVSEALAKERDENLNIWDKFVDTDLVNKITKLSSPISYKDETGKTVESKLDFDVSAQDLKEVSDLMKQLPRDPNAFFNQFKDEKGNPNHEALVILMLKAKSFDKARALSYSAGAEQRALAIEKSAKNTDFKSAETVSKGQVYSTIGEAQAAAIKNAPKEMFM